MPETLDLFPDDPAPVPGNTMELIAMPGIKLSPVQKSFRQLVANIEAAEKRLQEITALLDVFRPLFSNKLRPLLEERQKTNREMVLFLDQKLMQKGWTSNQRKTMTEIVCALAEQLFASAYCEEMETVFSRHSDVTVAEAHAAARAEFELDIEEMFGVELGTTDGEARTPDEMLREAMRQSEKREQEHAEQAEARAARRGKKKSASQAKAEQQAVDAGKLLKEIYRKLSSAVHPDREPDVAERARKTAIMSEVNKAYADGNLLKLLNLQFQVVKVDSRAAATLADEKLRLINHSLKQQYLELQSECRQLDAMVREEFDLDYYGVLSAPILQRALNVAVAGERSTIKIMKRDFAAVKTSDAHLKNWLKDQRLAMKDDEWLEEVLAEAIIVPRRGRRR